APLDAVPVCLRDGALDHVVGRTTGALPPGAPVPRRGGARGAARPTPCPGQAGRRTGSTAPGARCLTTHGTHETSGNDAASTTRTTRTRGGTPGRARARTTTSERAPRGAPDERGTR